MNKLDFMIPFWATLIIANMYIVADKHLQAGVFLIVAFLFVVFNYKYE